MSQTEVVNDASSSRASTEEKKKKKKSETKSRRPPNNAFRQQRLKAWQPILTPKTVLPLFFAVGIIFAPIGGLLLWASASVQELIIDYSDCTRDAPLCPELATIPSDKITSYFKNSTDPANEPQWCVENNVLVGFPLNASITTKSHEVPTTQCHLQFYIPDRLSGPVLLYYQLTNFYQNHRRYVQSFDQAQLKGTFRSNSSIAGSDCDPLKTGRINGTVGEEKAYYPCGLIANSLFNDTFANPVLLNAAGQSTAGNVTYNMTNQGIAWSSDRDLYGYAPYAPEDVIPPPNWQVAYPEGYNDRYPIPNLKEWEEFQVWMRTAGLPTFSKLALRNDAEDMQIGRYEMIINDYFPVRVYDGTKSILISTRTIMGGRNPFLGIAYIVVGGLCILLGGVFTVTQLIRPRKLGDHSYLTWNTDQPSTATTTGRAPRTNEAA
ncbi:hypothetical protein CERZMDRAFT_111641 [Cercospora zeae-maydis SCOH1-5]|uniref:Uncharacterized protein n=1 Tax=Cercospora zeae-maydis SCOH1-5 TaxID=717836 RepID=A0A6A6FIU8_9PEZI|nr:hypothetical protein CERZMDRAFT_111641 [Cercospora zeae-maydis SCOH1-5]